MRERISDAVILLAGAGSRLRQIQDGRPKPLINLLGRPLIAYVLDALAKAGVRSLKAVVGFQGDAIAAELIRLVPSPIELQVITNPDWQKQNGISLLAAAPYMKGPFLLLMGDHLFDQSIVDVLLEKAVAGELSLAVDRKLQSIFDMEDAMKVQTDGDRLTNVGKKLSAYDAIDTGLFVCPLEIFDYLNRSMQGGDCSLADGVRAMAAAGKARAIDIGDAWWQDVDTPEMYSSAERHLQNRGLVSGAFFPPGYQR